MYSSVSITNLRNEKSSSMPIEISISRSLRNISQLFTTLCHCPSVSLNESVSRKQ